MLFLTIDFRIGTPAFDPLSQRSSTTYLRIFSTSMSAEAVLAVAKTMKDIALKHFSGKQRLVLKSLIPLTSSSYQDSMPLLTSERSFLDPFSLTIPRQLGKMRLTRISTLLMA